jgi:penicillin-binding protein 1B
VGLDDNQPLGLSGSEAALPMWTRFMKRALAGRQSQPFDVPGGIHFLDIDPETGGRATAACPSILREAFLQGTEPASWCPAHPF